jgi:hypothetical protein
MPSPGTPALTATDHLAAGRETPSRCAAAGRTTVRTWDASDQPVPAGSAKGFTTSTARPCLAGPRLAMNEDGCASGGIPGPRVQLVDAWGTLPGYNYEYLGEEVPLLAQRLAPGEAVAALSAPRCEGEIDRRRAIWHSSPGPRAARNTAGPLALPRPPTSRISAVSARPGGRSGAGRPTTDSRGFAGLARGGAARRPGRPVTSNIL